MSGTYAASLSSFHFVPSGRNVSGPPCPSTSGQARVAVDKDEHGSADRKTDNNDHP